MVDALENYGTLVQICIGIIAFAALGVSLWNLKEIRLDRKVRQKPYLAFELGDNEVHVTIPCFTKCEDYGKLINSGLGAALSTHVIWIPKKIVCKNETCVMLDESLCILDSSKLKKDIFVNRSINTTRTYPAHILLNEVATLRELPQFIVSPWGPDFKLESTVRIDGILEIRTRDVFDNEYVFYQEFSAFKPNFDVSKDVVIRFRYVIKDSERYLRE